MGVWRYRAVNEEKRALIKILVFKLFSGHESISQVILVNGKYWSGVKGGGMRIFSGIPSLLSACNRLPYVFILATRVGLVFYYVLTGIVHLHFVFLFLYKLYYRLVPLNAFHVFFCWLLVFRCNLCTSAFS